MKRLLIIFLLTFATATASLAQYVDDLYAPPVRDRSERNNTSKSTKQSTPKAPKSTSTSNSSSKTGSYTPTQSSTSNDIMVTTTDQAIERRVMAMRADPVTDPEYRKILDMYCSSLERKYDANLYSVIWINDQIWVEPKYITSLFNGTDEAAMGVQRVLGSAVAEQSSVNYTINVYQTPVHDNWSFGFNVGMGYGWGYPYNNYWGGYWGGSPYYGGWHNPWYNSWSNPWCNPWYNPWYPVYPMYPGRPVYYDRHPSYYGNSRGNRYGSGGVAPAPNTRPSYNGSGNRGLSQGLGRGQAPAQNTRPARPEQTMQQRPITPAMQPSRPAYNPPSAPVNNGGFRDAGAGGRRR